MKRFIALIFLWLFLGVAAHAATGLSSITFTNLDRTMFTVDYGAAPTNMVHVYFRSGQVNSSYDGIRITNVSGATGASLWTNPVTMAWGKILAPIANDYNFTSISNLYNRGVLVNSNYNIILSPGTNVLDTYRYSSWRIVGATTNPADSIVILKRGIVQGQQLTIQGADVTYFTIPAGADLGDGTPGFNKQVLNGDLIGSTNTVINFEFDGSNWTETGRYFTPGGTTNQYFTNHWTTVTVNKLYADYFYSYTNILVNGTNVPTVNPTIPFVPYKDADASFADSPWNVLGTNSMGFATTNLFLRSYADLAYPVRGVLQMGYGSLASIVSPATGGEAQALAIGERSLAVALAASGSTAVGWESAAYATNFLGSTAFGSGAGSVEAATNGVFVGAGTGNFMTSSLDDTVVGNTALIGSGNSQSNVVAGFEAAYAVASPRNVTAIGAGAGYVEQGLFGVRQRDYSTFIGALAGVNAVLDAQITNAIAIGFNVPITNSNEIIIGNLNNTKAYLPLEVYAGGVLLGASTTLPTNMVVSTGASTAGAVATYVGTDGTNQAPSSVLIAGNTNVTVPGQLSFTGTTHSGLTLNNLTTSQRDALTGSNTNAGSVIWNTTTGRRNTQNGSEWTDGYVDGELQFGPKTTWLVFEGDSFTCGYAPFLLYPYPYALTNSVLTNSWIVPKTNCAVSGETIVQMQAEYAAEVAPFKPDGGHDSLLFIFAGINDAAADSGATMFANISNYWAQAKADGFKIVAFTLPHQNGSVQGRVNVMDFNRYVRAAYTNNCYDFLVDYARLVPIANEVSAGDNFHPGNQLSAYLAYTIGDILRQRRGILNFEELQPSFSGNMLDLTSYNNSAYRGFPYTARISGFSPGLLFEDLTTSDAVLINPSDSGAANFYRHSGTGDVTVADLRISLTTNVVINTHLIPSTNNVFDFGSSANRWATGYFQTGLWVGPSSYLTDFGLGLKADGVLYWTGRSDISSPADGVLLFTDTATTSFGRIQLGGTTSSFPAIKRNGTNINFRLADDSADAGITASASTFTGTVSGTALSVTNMVFQKTRVIRQALTHAGGTITLNLATNVPGNATCTLTGAVTFASSNLIDGSQYDLIFFSSGASNTITWGPEFRFAGYKPGSIAATNSAGLATMGHLWAEANGTNLLCTYAEEQ